MKYKYLLMSVAIFMVTVFPMNSAIAKKTKDKTVEIYRAGIRDDGIHPAQPSQSKDQVSNVSPRPSSSDTKTSSDIHNPTSDIEEMMKSISGPYSDVLKAIDFKKLMGANTPIANTPKPEVEVVNVDKPQAQTPVEEPPIEEPQAKEPQPLFPSADQFFPKNPPQPIQSVQKVEKLSPETVDQKPSRLVPTIRIIPNAADEYIRKMREPFLSDGSPDETSGK